MIGIIDYEMGNLGSVLNAFRSLGLPARMLESPAEAPDCRLLVLPGVGAFGDGIRHLRRRGWEPVLRDWIAADRPFLGICLGLQLLFATSEESPDARGLAVLEGDVRRFRVPPPLKVPHMGWNAVRQERPHPLWQGIADGTRFYFVHSYYVEPALPELVAASTHYGIVFSSACARANIFAVQFHPEKSAAAGLKLLENFMSWHP